MKRADLRRISRKTLFCHERFRRVPVAMRIFPRRNRLVETLRGSSTDEKDLYVEGSCKCAISNRICDATAGLRFSTNRLGLGDHRPCILGDCASADLGTRGDHSIRDSKPEVNPNNRRRYTCSLNAWPTEPIPPKLAYGGFADQREKRRGALRYNYMATRPIYSAYTFRRPHGGR